LNQELSYSPGISKKDAIGERLEPNLVADEKKEIHASLITRLSTPYLMDGQLRQSIS
jgi:hypothetical protein